LFAVVAFELEGSRTPSLSGKARLREEWVGIAVTTTPASRRESPG